MSVFEDNQSTDETLSDNLEDWIGEGKKYATQEDALRSVPHAQKHIDQLEKSYAKLKEEFDKAQSAAEQAAKLDEITELLKQGATKPTPSDNSEESKGVTPEALEELIKSRVPEYIERATTQKQQETNVQAVQSHLVERFGGEQAARKALEEKATELGISLTDMKDMAAKSPKAVLAYFPTQGQPNRGMQSSANTEAMSATSSAREGTWAFYETLRKTDPKTYWKPATQQRLMKDRAEKGEAFYK